MLPLCPGPPQALNARPRLLPEQLERLAADEGVAWQLRDEKLQSVIKAIDGAGGEGGGGCSPRRSDKTETCLLPLPVD